MIVTVCLTNFTHVINQNYFLKETVWGEVHHTRHCPEQGVKFLIIKTYDDAGGGKIGWVVFLMTSARKIGRELVIQKPQVWGLLQRPVLTLALFTEH